MCSVYLKRRDEALSGAREVLLQGSFYEVSLALVGVASLAVLPILEYDFVERKGFLYENQNFFSYPNHTIWDSP